jgi:transglutaminase-like putative cysteine protease
MHPFGGDDQTGRTLTRPASVVVPAVVLAALALSAFAVGPDLRIGAEDPGRSSGDPAVGEVRDPDGRRSPRALAPYLGFEETLDTANRGDLGDDVVLRVQADAPDFWRGQSFDRWNGRTWSRSSSAPIVRAGADRGSEPGASAGPDVVFEQFEQRFRVEAPAIGELFGAYRPVAVGLPSQTYRYGYDGSIELVRPLGRGSEYSVSSLRARVTADVLRARDPRATDRRPSDGVMQGPVPERVARLARRVTAGAPTTYDAVRAIETWMGDHTEYTTDIPPLPAGADAVEQHLFVDRKGFCVQIATSTAVMLHSLDVPVRVGVGFTPGDESLLGGSFTVRGRDAHAWVEVWFPGVGWQAFDPTADVPLAGEYDTSLWARVRRLLDRLLPGVVVLVAAAVAAAAWWWLRRRRRRVEPPWVADLFGRVEREGRARGRPRAPAETPTTYLEALAAGPIPAPDALAEVERVVTVAAYGPRGVDAEARAAAEAAWSAAVASSPPRGR